MGILPITCSKIPGCSQMYYFGASYSQATEMPSSKISSTVLKANIVLVLIRTSEVSASPGVRGGSSTLCNGDAVETSC